MVLPIPCQGSSGLLLTVLEPETATAASSSVHSIPACVPGDLLPKHGALGICAVFHFVPSRHIYCPQNLLRIHRSLLVTIGHHRSQVTIVTPVTNSLGYEVREAGQPVLHSLSLWPQVGRRGPCWSVLPSCRIRTWGRLHSSELWLKPSHGVGGYSLRAKGLTKTRIGEPWPGAAVWL